MTYAPGTPASSPAPNPLAMVSFVLGAISVGLVVIFVLLQTVLISNGQALSLGILNAAHGLVSGLIGAAAIITGAIALSGNRARKPLAAAGLALGAAEVVGVLAGLVSSLLLAFVY